MIRFEFRDLDVTATDVEARTVEGVIVPYGEVGRIAGVQYRFMPGSVKLARGRTPLLIDHDRGRPVGVLAELTDTDAGAAGRFRIDDTADGDLALKQAASGSRGSLSVGATVEAAEDNGGVLDVTAGLVHEVSLLALGAFPGATVRNVAAESDPPVFVCGPDDVDESAGVRPTQPETEETPMPDDTAPEAVEAAAAPPMILAERPRAPRELSAGQYVQAMLAAQQGDREAREILAALTETISTDIAGLLPPTYESSVIGPAPVDRVLYDTFKGKPIPAVGLQVQKPTWTTFPDGAWAATVDADATTGKAVIGLNAATIERWDWATAISYTAAKRSSPDAITTIYAGAVEAFYLDVETKIAALLIAAAGTANAAVKFGAGIAAFYTRCGRAPEVLVMAPDVWGMVADATTATAPFGVSGPVVAGSGGLRGSYAGLPAVASGALAAGTKILATRRAIDVRVTEPAQLTANAIGALNVELGVVGEGIFDTDVALEVMLLTAGTPVGLMAAEASGKSSK